MVKAHNRIDMTGKRIGRLLVISPVKKDKKKILYWRCQCDCGNIKVISGSVLRRRKQIQSCGCIRNEKAAERRTGLEEISGSYWNNLKHNAKARDIEFSISLKYIWDLFLKQDRKCSLTGLLILLSFNKNHEEQTASLDRIDSRKGYVEGNVQWVHKKVNKLKAGLPVDEFLHWCKLVADHNSSNN